MRHYDNIKSMSLRINKTCVYRKGAGFGGSHSGRFEMCIIVICHYFMNGADVLTLNYSTTYSTRTNRIVRYFCSTVQDYGYSLTFVDDECSVLGLGFEN